MRSASLGRWVWAFGRLRPFRYAVRLRCVAYPPATRAFGGTRGAEAPECSPVLDDPGLVDVLVVQLLDVLGSCLQAVAAGATEGELHVVDDLAEGVLRVL